VTTVPSRTALVFRHHESIHLGNLEPVLRDHDYDIRYVDVADVEFASIDPAEADLLIVLGGQMGVYEEASHPFITAELAHIRGRLNAERAIFGVCLGAQLMAGALGARVYPGAVTDVGYREIEPTDAGLASPIRHLATIPILEWHGDTFDLPEGATRLASSSAYANEAFAIGTFALAVQFHPEATAEMHEQWLDRDSDEVATLGLDPDQLRQRNGEYSPAMQDASCAMLSEWLDGLDSSCTTSI
jgi:GMP synthase (glutamine-hydrolysing)